MNISACGCGNSARAAQTDFRAAFKQKLEDFKSLAKAINSGDTAGAQTALDAVTKDIQNDPRIAKSGQSDKINTDLTALSDALKSGNAEDAKTAFATLAQDLKGLRHVGHHHGHHRVDNDGDADDAAFGNNATTTAATDSTSSGVGSALDVVV